MEELTEIEQDLIVAAVNPPILTVLTVEEQIKIVTEHISKPAPTPTKADIITAVTKEVTAQIAEVPKPTDGKDGSHGSDGKDGIDGAPGAEGPMGPEGPQGTLGAPGAIGPSGPAGPQGEVGPQGETGIDGKDGVEGPSGPQGERGEKGDRGPRGYKGEKGARGERGPAGGGTTYVTQAGGGSGFMQEIILGEETIEIPYSEQAILFECLEIQDTGSLSLGGTLVIGV